MKYPLNTTEQMFVYWYGINGARKFNLFVFMSVLVITNHISSRNIVSKFIA